MNSNVNLTVLKGTDGQIIESIMDKELAERFKFGLSGLEVKKVKEFIDEVQKDFKNIEIAKFSLTKKGNTQYFLYKEKTAEFVSNEISDIHIFINSWKKNYGYVEILGMDPKELEFFYDKYIDFFLDTDGYKIQLHSYYIENGLKYDVNTIGEEDIEDISTDFYPDFKSTDMFFEEFLKAKENIVVIAGKSGIGKSKFATLALKYAIEHGEEFSDDDDYYEEDGNINVAYVKNEKILALDTFWIDLRKFDYNFVILDDLDFFLSPRNQVVNSEIEELKNQFVSHFLSFSDGLLPNKTKFIITTNRDIDSIDEALLREGRMFGVFSFSELTYDQAKEIWIKNELNEEDFEKEFSEEKVLQSKLGSKIHSYKANDKRKRANFLKDDSEADISKRYQEDKRVGLV